MGSVILKKRQVRTVSKGFTLIEILVVIGIIAILASIVIVAINPARQFAQARNSQRTSNVNAILNAVGQNIADNKGILICTGINASGTVAQIDKANANLRPCIVPTYMPELPVDPVGGTNTCTTNDCSLGTYVSGYTITVNATGRVTICAPEAAAETSIAGAASICVTR